MGPLTNKTLGPKARVVLQKIITRKISIASKNVTYKKMLRISFSIEKKINKKGIQNRRFGLRKISVFFQISKNHNSVNFCFRQKSYKEKMFGASFSIEKKIKKPKNRKKIFFWNFQKIITRKILIVSKNFTSKKMLRISFSIGKKIKKKKK